MGTDFTNTTFPPFHDASRHQDCHDNCSERSPQTASTTQQRHQGRANAVSAERGKLLRLISARGWHTLLAGATVAAVFSTRQRPRPWARVERGKLRTAAGCCYVTGTSFGIIAGCEVWRSHEHEQRRRGRRCRLIAATPARASALSRRRTWLYCILKT